jgi:excisionase family DNA binding protein
MPRAKPKPERSRPAPANGPLPEVLTLREAAAYLRLPEAEVVRLVREQGLPARQAAAEWRFLLSAVRDWLATGRAPGSNKEAWMKLVGVWKDDPFFDELRREIERQRRQLASEEDPASATRLPVGRAP